MKKILLFALLLFSVSCLASEAAVKVGISVTKGGNSFYLSVGDYFAVPQREVMIVRERRIPDEEIPVVFYLARQARVEPSVIMNMRLKGSSWMDITLHFGLGPDIYYVPVQGNMGSHSPYGHAYGYYRNKPRKDWKKMRMSDQEIINQVNLKFMSEHYNSQPETIMKMRDQNKGFGSISADLERQRPDHNNVKPMPQQRDNPPPPQADQNKKNQDNKGKNNNQKNNGKGNGNGHGNGRGNGGH